MVIGAAAGLIEAGQDDRRRTTAVPEPTPPPVLQPLPAVPTTRAPSPTASPSATRTPAPASPSPSPSASRTSAAPAPPSPTAPAPPPRNSLFRDPGSQVARVYFDGGHSGWHPPSKQVAALKAAGAATSGHGIFTNVANFRPTADERTYARQVLAALGAPSALGAVIDTSRNGNGAPAPGQWCDPEGRALGQPPTTQTGERLIDAYLLKLPGESDGCTAAPGAFSPEYAHGLATS
ncbi:glycoside hydrolase family 6 protein [Streptomyces cyaneofuscatus]|uniref:glycoside hydrolase family 6 protein n=1 Tax=Streptomyces cyaneofuscatus TaxID=66883 RepID=UPI0037A31C5A